MDCQKCAGLMSYEGFYGAESDAVWYYPGWRCIHCGDIVDSVISLNRRLNGELHNADNGHEHASAGHPVNGNGNGHGGKNIAKKRDFTFKRGRSYFADRNDQVAEDEYSTVLEGSNNDFVL